MGDLDEMLGPPTQVGPPSQGMAGGLPPPVNRYARVPLTEADMAAINPGPSAKLGFTVFGPPGTGKTVLEGLFPGRVAMISFEQKAEPIRIGFFRESERIRVLDVYPWFQDGSLESLKATQDKLEQMIPRMSEEFQPHWWVLDDAEGVRTIGGGYMRYVLDLPRVGGIDMNLWAERNAAMDRIMLLCKRHALMGAIASVYPEDKDEGSGKGFAAKKATKLEDGASTVSGASPKWFGKMVQHFPILIETSQAYSNMSRRFVYRAHVVTCKEPGILTTGQSWDFTAPSGYHNPTTDTPIPWGPRMYELFERANRLCKLPAPEWTGPRQVAPAAPAAPVVPPTHSAPVPIAGDVFS